MLASSNAKTKQNDADKDNAEMGTIASSNSQRERERERKLSQCLVAYTATSFFSVPSFSFLMNPLHSFFFTNLLSPHKTLPLPPSQFHSGKQSWFFFFGQNSCRALHCHSVVTAPFFFLFFFLVKKNFTEALIAEKKFSLETIQNIDASSTFDRILWLKLQQWWFGAVSL